MSRSISSSKLAAPLGSSKHLSRPGPEEVDHDPLLELSGTGQAEPSSMEQKQEIELEESRGRNSTMSSVAEEEGRSSVDDVVGNMPRAGGRSRTMPFRGAASASGVLQSTGKAAQSSSGLLEEGGGSGAAGGLGMGDRVTSGGAARMTWESEDEGGSDTSAGPLNKGSRRQSKRSIMNLPHLSLRRPERRSFGEQGVSPTVTSPTKESSGLTMSRISLALKGSVVRLGEWLAEPVPAIEQDLEREAQVNAVGGTSDLEMGGAEIERTVKISEPSQAFALQTSASNASAKKGEGTNGVANGHPTVGAGMLSTKSMEHFRSIAASTGLSIDVIVQMYSEDAGDSNRAAVLEEIRNIAGDGLTDSHSTSTGFTPDSGSLERPDRSEPSESAPSNSDTLPLHPTHSTLLSPAARYESTPRRRSLAKIALHNRPSPIPSLMQPSMSGSGDSYTFPTANSQTFPPSRTSTVSRKLFTPAPMYKADGTVWTPGLPAIEGDQPNFNRIMVNYCQAFLVSILIGLPCNAFVYGLSLIGWRWSDALKTPTVGPAEVYDRDLADDANPRTTMNPTAFTIICTIMFVSALPMFNAVQFMCIHTWKVFRKSGLIVTAPISCIGVAAWLWGMWRTGWPFWYYYVDVIIILVSYVSCTFLSGYYGIRETVTRLERIKCGLEFSIIECYVSVAAIFYGIIMMPVFSSLDENYKLVWRFTVHPIYWSMLVKYATRRLLVARSGTHLCAIDTLSMAHAQTHIAVMQVSVVAGLASLKDLFTSVVVVSFTRLIGRSTKPTQFHASRWARDWFTRRLTREVAELRTPAIKAAKLKVEMEVDRYLMAIETQTEIILENSAVLFASTLALLFLNYGDLFSMTMPNSDDVGTGHVVWTVLIQLVFNVVVDIASIYFNSRWASKLPFQRTWREMWKHKKRFFGFQ
ncbi:hypothetical protein HDV00_011525, partial [Rhizophlyctis rosea]